MVGGESRSDGSSAEVLDALAQAGATWWDERMPFDDRILLADPIRRRIDQGPPRP
jgi:hypothetical protein